MAEHGLDESGVSFLPGYVRIGILKLLLLFFVNVLIIVVAADASCEGGNVPKQICIRFPRLDQLPDLTLEAGADVLSWILPFNILANKAVELENTPNLIVSAAFRVWIAGGIVLPTLVYINIIPVLIGTAVIVFVGTAVVVVAHLDLIPIVVAEGNYGKVLFEMHVRPM